MSKTGYLYEYDPAFKRVREQHRIVMERHLGRLLTTEEQVHHINHVRHDNRIENLVVVSHAEHVELHREVFERECPKCGKVFKPVHQKTKYCSIRCSKLKGEVVACIQCGAAVYKKPSRIAKYDRQFCGIDCLNGYRALHWRSVLTEAASQRNPPE
jgi:RNase P subunit RPR2